MEKEEPHTPQTGSTLRQIILGGQDGLVNVLGIVLGLAGAVSVNPAIGAGAVIVGGLAATFAESISMAAVAYTSGKAQRDYYYRELENEKREIKEVPEVEKEEIRLIYMKKGFRGRQLEGIVKKITSNEKTWIDVMMTEELGLAESKDINPLREGAVVGGAAFVGSLIPLFPFFFMSVQAAMPPSLILSALALFFAGAYKGKITLGKWWKTGIELMLIGLAAAFIGYLVGSWAGTMFG
ncbi:MAG TPA: VIT1/CCC1 transporter family protein [Candidatus Bilamarchaeaceae archaeon]|nr:VIT1/CCC1 transporter family protein [Candidatus Bilamarchaeaceae archaeon]